MQEVTQIFRLEHMVPTQVFTSAMGSSMQPRVKHKLAGRTLLSLYCVGVAVCLVTQLIVMMEHGPKVYASLLWGLLYPVRLFITDASTRMGYALHASLKSTTATGIGIAFASALFGLVVPALVGLARSNNRLGRYFGLAALAVFALLALFWGVLPNVF